MKNNLKQDIKSILVLSAPILLENLLQVFLGFIDSYFAGQITDIAIAGIGVANLLVNMLLAFFSALTVGTTAIVARNFGKGDYEQVNRSMTHSLVLSIIIGTIVGTAGYIFRVPFLTIAGANETVLPVAMPYYIITFCPSVALCVQLVLSSCLRAIKDTKTPMYVTVITNIFKLITSVIFLRMDMGVFGLGLSTTLSRLLGAILLYLKLIHYSKDIHLVKCKLDKKEFAPLLRIGMPVGIEKIIMKSGQLLFMSMVAHLGTNALVAHNVGCNIDNVLWTTANSFGLASCTFIGIYMGKEDIPKAKYMAYLTLAVSVSVIVIMSAFVFVFDTEVVSIFTKTEEIHQIMAPIMLIISFQQPSATLLQIMINSLQGAGDTKVPMYLTTFGIWVVRDGIGYLFAYVLGFGLLGFWMACALDNVSRSIFLYLRFRTGKWQTIKI